jgi:hypothetical protein
MNRKEIKTVLDELTGDIDNIADKKVVTIIKTLVNLVEILAQANEQLRETNQQLKDEVNRLKGEQGKPNIRKQTKKGDDDQGNSDHSSEKNRNKGKGDKKKKPKNKKTQTVRVDRQVTVEFDKATLPFDVVFKGYELRVVQDLKIITDNIAFKLPVYYSTSLKKTFIAPMPDAYKGSEFGPHVKSLMITFYRDSGMTIPAIERFLTTFGIYISRSTIIRMLVDDHDDFHQEKEDIFNAGMQATPYQHVDDTGCRVNGKSYYAHIFCNPFFTAYFTRKKKDRLTLLDILCRGNLNYALNQDAYDLMVEFGLTMKWREQIKPLLQSEPLTHTEMDAMLKQLFPNPKKHSANRKAILESAALAYYQQSAYFIQYLMCDDAPQFNRLGLYHALCWVHEGRHYKKLTPFSDLNRKVLDAFLEQFWDYYHALLAYKKNPSDISALHLSEQFDSVFSITTGYEALDCRIAMTRTKKKALLLVLEHPFLPLENNSAELGARVQARIRDINLQTISKEGTDAKDTFATIVQTARKLGVNIYHYIYDRISKKFEMVSLAEIILIKSQEPSIAA